MKYNRITTIHNNDTNEYFFSTDHCQPNLPNNLVPVTATLPYYIKPREGFETGILETKEDYKRFQDLYLTEIPNPDSNYQA